MLFTIISLVPFSTVLRVLALESGLSFISTLDYCKNKTFKVFTKVKLLSRSEVSKNIWERRREIAKVGK